MIAVSSGIIKQHRFADLNLTQRFDQLGTLRFPFNAKNPLWQSRCDGKTYGCFRPHVVYNEKNKNYVLWINVYDNVVGYRVFTSKTPIGPFTEVAEPRLSVNSAMPAAGLNNGDHDLFIDDNGTGYLAFTDWRTKGTIVIEQLSADFLTGTGKFVKDVTSGQTEAPGLFKRNGIYYVVYSDPNCGYCAGTGTSYKTAKSLLGPWSDGKKISDNSCGGQPSFVSTIKINRSVVYLYGSDLWNNAAKNEALANYYWAPLTFAEDGSIEPLRCLEEYKYPRAKTLMPASNLNNTTGQEEFSPECEITQKQQRAQTFTVKKIGKISEIKITVFKNNNPDKPLTISVYATNADQLPSGKALYQKDFLPQDIGWSAKNVALKPNLKVMPGKQYAIVLKTASTTGCYGVQVNKTTSFQGGTGMKSTDNGMHFIPNENENLKFETYLSN